MRLVDIGRATILEKYSLASQVIGIDTDVARIAIAQSHCRDLNNIIFEVGSVTQLSFQDNFFDLVLLFSAPYNLLSSGGKFMDKPNLVQPFNLKTGLSDP